ncbi:MAG: anti-sigma regulatory factor (Ser/Thr protein kinase) [Planctomycetota bacterium]|jgi:anti-sigma regulatory factor (Ser/Thr protein kinase)
MNGREMKLEIKNQIESVATVVSSFEAFASKHRISTRIRRELCIVVDEVLNNVIRHAFAQDDQVQLIQISLKAGASGITLTVSDEGQPFNPLDRPQPQTDLTLDEREIGGLGIHIVRNLMTESHYERQGARNVLTLIRKWDSKP